MPAPTTDARPMRSDARRNRERLVASARDLFATAGVDASVEDITRHAGVGMGTLYRHFPTKEELIEAVLEETYDELLSLAAAAAREPDAWTGLAAFLEQVLTLHAANRALKDIAARNERGIGRVAEMRQQLRPLLTSLVRRAQEQGTLRADLSPEDVPLLLWGGIGVIDFGAAVGAEIWRRYLGLVLDGLRSPAATPIACAPLTPAQVDRARMSRR